MFLEGKITDILSFSTSDIFSYLKQEFLLSSFLFLPTSNEWMDKMHLSAFNHCEVTDAGSWLLAFYRITQSTLPGFGGLPWNNAKNFFLFSQFYAI